MQREAELFHSAPRPTAGNIVPTPVGSMNFNVLSAIIFEAGVLQLGRGAEIGIFQGATSAHLLKRFPQLTLFCVDPFADYSEFEPNRTQEAMSASEQKARAAIAPFGNRAVLIKDFSVSAAKHVEDNSLDFVFIDAIHTHDAVTEDLNAWYPKVRPGGLVSGHDYSWGGVQSAVREFIAKQGRAAFYTPSTSDVWFFGK